MTLTEKINGRLAFNAQGDVELRKALRALLIAVQELDDWHECDKLHSGCGACCALEKIEKELV